MILKVGAFLLYGAAALWAASPASAQKQTLKMAYWAGPSHHMVKTQAEWAKTVLAASNGNLNIEIDMAALAKPEGQYDLVKDGVRDMVWHVAGYTAGRFPLFQAAELPFVCTSATACAPALYTWYTENKLMEREFTDTKLVVAFNHGPGLLHAAKPVRALEEMKGLKIRVGGSGVPIARALGMSVVAMPATEAYEALSRKTADGVLFPWEAMMSFRLNEVATFHLEVPGGMYTSSFMININPKSFDGLNAANRAALMKAGGLEGSKFFGRAWDAADKASRDDGISKKNIIETLAPDQLVKWKQLLQPVRDDWIKMAKEKGLDGNKLIADLEARVKAQSM